MRMVRFWSALARYKALVMSIRQLQRFLPGSGVRPQAIVGSGRKRGAPCAFERWAQALSLAARWIGAALLLGAALAGSGGCTEPADQAQPPKAADLAPPSPILQDGALHYSANHPQIGQLKLAPAVEARESQGEIAARLAWNEERTQRVRSAFAGQVNAILADLGQAVRPGQVLARLASAEFGAAQADAQRSEVDLQLAQQVMRRRQALLELDVIARKEYEEAQAEVQRARAEAERAQSRMRLYGAADRVDLDLGLRASIAGLIVERNISPGQEVRPDGDAPPLFVISDPSSLWLHLEAREADLPFLRPGSSLQFEVTALKGRRFPARVLVVGAQIDPQTRTVRVRALVDNADRVLRSEMIATAYYARREQGLLEVASDAVFLWGKQHAVFVSDQPGVYRIRSVEVAHLGAERVLLAGGLKPGEQVVMQNALLLMREMKFAEDAARRSGAPR